MTNVERQRNKGMHYIINANRCKKNAWDCIHDHRIMYVIVRRKGAHLGS